MNADAIKHELINVLNEIQVASGEQIPSLTGASKPLEELPNFDSKIWPVAIGMLAAKVGIDIPSDANIFRKEKSTDALTIDEAVAMVMALVGTNGKSSEKAAS